MAAAAGLLLATACARDEQGDGSVTVAHRFGETTVPAPPTRVVSAGFTEQDDLLALGVVPIAVTNWWGDQPFGVWPWAQPKLGAAQPVVLNLERGLQFDQIAALRPDLIVATNAGVDQESYHRLSEIAPTIAQSTDDPFFEPWKDQATAIGQALFQRDQMASLINEVDNRFTAAAHAHVEFEDKEALLLQGTLWNDNVVATLTGWRTEFLTQMGLTIPEDITAYRVDEHRAVIPRAAALDVLDQADVLIWTTENEAEQAAITALGAAIQAKNVFTGKDLAGAIAFSSVLSLPVVADQLPPMLSRVLG